MLEVPDAIRNPSRYPAYVVEKAYQRFFHRKGPAQEMTLDELSRCVESVRSVWAEWVRYLSRCEFTHVCTLTFKDRRLCPDARTCTPDDPAHRRAYGCGVPGMPSARTAASDFLTHCERGFVVMESGKLGGRRHLHSLASFRPGSGSPERRWPPQVGFSRQEIIRSPVGAISYVTKSLVFDEDAPIWAKGLSGNG